MVVGPRAQPFGKHPGRGFPLAPGLRGIPHLGPEFAFVVLLRSPLVVPCRVQHVNRDAAHRVFAGWPRQGRSPISGPEWEFEGRGDGHDREYLECTTRHGNPPAYTASKTPT